MNKALSIPSMGIVFASGASLIGSGLGGFGASLIGAVAGGIIGMVLEILAQRRQQENEAA